MIPLILYKRMPAMEISVTKKEFVSKKWIRKISSFCLPYLICILNFYILPLVFVPQISPDVITVELMRDFGIGAVIVWVIFAFYYLYVPLKLAGCFLIGMGPAFF